MSLIQQTAPGGDTYVVEVRCTLPHPLWALVANLQSAFDNGAAGSFEVSPSDIEVGVERTIRFTRSVSDDMEYVQIRMARDLIVREVAVCRQLAQELREAADVAALLPIVQVLESEAALTCVSGGSPSALDAFGSAGEQGIADAQAALLDVNLAY